MYYVYKITNQINNKIYIGKASDPYVRWHVHKTTARLGANNPIYEGRGAYNYIHRAINKHGEENFLFEIIAEFRSEEKSFAHEILLIKNMQTRNPKIGYNLTDGGEGSSGRRHSQKAIELIRKKALGRKHSNATKKEMSRTRAGEGCKHNKLVSSQVIEIRALHKAGHTYASLGRLFGVTRTHIRSICLRRKWKHI